MKPNLPTLLCLLAAPLLPLPLQAQVSATAKADAPDAAPPRHRVVKTSDIIGMNVQNKQDEILGQVKDLVVDVESGLVIQVIVSTGASHAAVPPGVLRPDETGRWLLLDASPEKLKSAPHFEMADWVEFSDAEHLTAVYRHFGLVPAFTYIEKGETLLTDKNNEGQFLIPESRMVQGLTVRKLLGLRVMNEQDHLVGKVEDLLVDLPAGRVAVLIISSGAYVGLHDELSAIPPPVLRFDPDNGFLIMSASKNSLSNAPHFKPALWPDFSESTYVRRVYRAYQMEPYFTNQDNARAPKPPGQEDKPHR